MDDLRYPIGRFDHEGSVSAAERTRWMGQVEALPGQMADAVVGLAEDQLATPYRPGGWTLRQVVHHVADSHLNCYIRFKWALTEEEPTIKAYDEKGWAELPDHRVVPVGTNLEFLALVHTKWAILLRTMTEEQWSRRFIHPVSGPTRLDRALGLYAWHGRHHVAHITRTVAREGW